jgi:lipoprotein-releasing system permease protein
MAGFVDEMKDRLHGILSDIELADPGLGEIPWPDLHVKEIERVVGDDLEAITTIVRVPALLNLKFRERQWTQQIILMGIDEKTYGEVTKFHPFVMNDHKKNEISFKLEEDGYEKKLDHPTFGSVGWPYRRAKAAEKKELERLFGPAASMPRVALPVEETIQADQPADFQLQLADLPSAAPNLNEMAQEAETTSGGLTELSAFDPGSMHRDQLSAEEMFDPERDQYTGIILGLAISNRKYVDADTGETKDAYMIRPGDDVQVTLPTAGPNPSPVSENCTVVDFYSSNMHEYDSSFAFMPLKSMQKLRGMIDPSTGNSTVSAIQIRLKEGADTAAIRDKLIQRFPAEQYPYIIQTWQDTQRPLLSAVNLEVTILNILLFLIIAVAGFGILATFYMIVVEKTKDIGILKALGAPSRGVMSIFLGYGLSLGAVGTGAGILLGLLFVFNINGIAGIVQRITGQEIFDPTIYYFSEIPTIINPTMIVWVAFGAILIAVLASVLPAIRAARMHPVKALRYE